MKHHKRLVRLSGKMNAQGQVYSNQERVRDSPASADTNIDTRAFTACAGGILRAVLYYEGCTLGVDGKVILTTPCIVCMDTH